MSEETGDKKIVFGEDTLDSVKPPKPPSKAEQKRIAANADHGWHVDTSRPPAQIPAEPVRFPEPPPRKEYDQRYTLDTGAHRYTKVTWDPETQRLDDVIDPVEVGLIERAEHPSNIDKKSTEPRFAPNFLVEEGDWRYYIRRVGDHFEGENK